MKKTKLKKFFVSYSRKDARVVKPVVEIIRATGARVFRDEDSIPPGKKWKDVLATSIEDSDVVVVFWSKDSSKSKTVKEEYTKGVMLDKDIIPVLLDDCPLCKTLQEYQCIDFRPLFWLPSPWYTCINAMASLLQETLNIKECEGPRESMEISNDILIVYNRETSENETKKLNRDFRNSGFITKLCDISKEYGWLSLETHSQMHNCLFILVVIKRNDIKRMRQIGLGDTIHFIGRPLFSVHVDFEPQELPHDLRGFQSFDFNDSRNIIDLLEGIKSKGKEV